MKIQAGHHDAIPNSMTDLMTSLMVIFVLLLVTNLNRVVAKTAESRQQKKIIKNLVAQTQQNREDLISRFREQRLQVEKDKKDPLLLVVRLGSERLQFQHDSRELSSTGISYLRNDFVPKISKIVRDKKDVINSIVIEGHTNTIGNKENPEHNLELSQFRAYEVLVTVLDELKADQDTKRLFLELISANGRGSNDLVLDETGKEDKEKSRRVDIKIRVKSIEQKKSPELQKILKSDESR